MLDALLVGVLVIFLVGTGIGWVMEAIAEWRLDFAKAKRKGELATWQDDPDVVRDSYTFD